MAAPTCFISYSWDSNAHKDWVRSFADELCNNGVDTRLDQWDVYPGIDLTTYMETCVRDSNFVLLICTPTFAQKANKGKGGVGYEKAIVTGEIFEGSPSPKKFVPILRSGDARDSLPGYLKSRAYLDFRDDSGFQTNLEQLLRHIYESPRYKRPPLGTRPDFDNPAATPPAPPERSVVSPLAAFKNWLAVFITFATFAIMLLVVALSLSSAPAATPTPPSVAGPTLAAPSTAPTLLAVAVVLTATPSPETPTILPPPTNTRIPTFTLLPPTNTRVPTVAPSPIPTLGIGSTKTAKDGSLMMFVPAGEFLMGSSDADKNSFSNEKPQHTVYLDEFWIGKYEVTNTLYKNCVDAGKCSVPKFWANGTIPTGKETHPVVGVSWSDAGAYAQWMGGRLPTEAEWEKAACWDEVKKAKRSFPWGDVFDVQKANTSESGIGDTTPVGRYSPQGDSPYGVSDMAGNVWEWVADWYSATYYSKTPKNNPKGADSGPLRVLRGGSWSSFNAYARCAYRDNLNPGNQGYNLGFRVAESGP